MMNRIRKVFSTLVALMMLLGLCCVPCSAMAVGIGDYIEFGHYEQDNDLFNGKEPIEWLILKSDGANILLISRYALDAVPFNSATEMTTWADCSLRLWLNTTFMDAAFTEDERVNIVPTTVWNSVGDPTTDSVFLMNEDDALNWFQSNAARVTSATDYAVAQGAQRLGSNACWYWLRSVGRRHDCGAYINSSGLVCGWEGKGINANSDNGAVRPVIWVSMNAFGT